MTDSTNPPHELTLRAILTAIFVAAIIGASYPYVVLKLGYGPNISVVSAFFGFIILNIIGWLTHRRASRQENNLVQTAGTAAGQSGFMCVVLAAIDMLNAKPELGFSLHLTPLQIFVWMSLAGMLGVLLAVPLRKHYIDEENLQFADGTAAGETLLILDQSPKETGPRIKALVVGMVSSGFVTLFRDDNPLRSTFKWWKSSLHFFASWEPLRMGSEVSLLSFGSGMIVGLRIGLSMGLGMLLSWVLAPGILFDHHIVPAATFKDVLRWVMWPATGLMVAGGLTALVLKWQLIIKTFSTLRKGSVASEISLRQLATPVAILSLALCAWQYFSLGFPVWLSVLSLILSFVLMLVGTRVLGETNWAPISAMANLMQAVFAVLSPGNMAINMIGSGMSGTVAANGEHLMQDFKAGKIVGSTPRYLTILQLIGVPVGALALSVVYPALRAQYGIGEKGLSSPISVKWAGFAELINQGFASLPRGCFAALLVALFLGTIITIVEPRYSKFVPSPTGVGIGMLVPGMAIMPMVVGGLIQWLWSQKSPKTEQAYNLPLSSGFIAGEALVVLAFTLLEMSRI